MKLKMVEHECRLVGNQGEAILSKRQLPKGVPCDVCDPDAFGRFLEARGVAK